MKLSLEQMKSIAMGAVRVTHEEDGFHFYRFTAAQELLYKNRKDAFYEKTFCTAGIQLAFRTNSEHLFLKTLITKETGRRYFAFDVFVNGEKSGTMDNFSGVTLPLDYTNEILPLGEFEKEFVLGPGEKEVHIYFPWSAKAVVQELILDDGAVVTPVKRKYRLLSFGDSITQGYDALYPSNRYVSRLADALDAEEFNKGIGGEMFFPALALETEDFVPDYITVAYGTNDWSTCTEGTFQENCKAFYANLTATYPNTKIYAITPIWRKDHGGDRVFGKFETVEKIIKDTAKGYENITVVSGFDFVGHDEQFFADLRLHPNDEGFRQYAETLIKHIRNS